MAILLVIFFLPKHVSASFFDTPASHPYFNAIEWAKNKGVVEGYSDGLFRPEQMVNRAEFTKILSQSISPHGYDTYTHQCFPDVLEGDWFEPYVCNFKNFGYINGYPDGTFRPADTINFAEAAKIIVNTYFGVQQQLRYNDAWHVQYVQSLSQVGAVPPTLQRAGQSVNRGEMVEMMYRMETGDAQKYIQREKLEPESYLSCGCGCCGGAEPQEKCLFREQGDSLEDKRESDRRLGESNACDLMGCSLGTKYVFCDDWNLYSNPDLEFEVMIPADASIQMELDDDFNKLTMFEGRLHQFEIRLRKHGNTPIAQYRYLDFPIDHTSRLDGEDAMVYKAPNGYCDGPSCGSPFLSYVVKHGLYFYHLTFYGDIKLDDIETEIRSSFKIIK